MKHKYMRNQTYMGLKTSLISRIKGLILIRQPKILTALITRIKTTNNLKRLKQFRNKQHQLHLRSHKQMRVIQASRRRELDTKIHQQIKTQEEELQLQIKTTMETKRIKIKTKRPQDGKEHSSRSPTSK